MATTRLRPATTLAEIARSALLDDLNHLAFVVYVRLVAATEEQGRRVRVPNRLLAADPRGAARALRELEGAGLIRTHTRKTATGPDRSIELL